MRHPTAATSTVGPKGRFGSHLLIGLVAAVGLALIFGTAIASAAAKQPVDFFGGVGARGGQFAEGGQNGVAVNQSGAGAANQGDIYVTDERTNRIQRFSREDNGTPADGADDTYSFVSAWGADVDSFQPGFGYEVCTLASACQEGIPSTASGALDRPAGVAIDQDTGDVYVVDRGNNRVSAYAGDGTFLRSFGFDVVASGPDDSGTGYEVCIAANGDVCKAGLPGSGAGQIGAFPANTDNEMGIAISPPDGAPAAGTVFLADRANQRIDTYRIDGTSPASIASGVFSPEWPRSVAVDSRGIVYASNSKNNDEVERYDSENADGGGVGFLAPIAAGVNEVQQVTVDATAGTFNLTYNGETTVDLPLDATASATAEHSTPGVIDSVSEALTALPSIGGRNLKDGREVNVTGGGSGGGGNGTSPYRIEFGTGLGARDVEQISAASGATPLSGGAGVSATTLTAGQPGLVPDLPTSALAVDLNSDTLYVQRAGGSQHVVQQFGPANAPGLTAPPTAFDEIHGSAFGTFDYPQGLAIDQPSGRIYVAAPRGEAGPGVNVLDTPGPGPNATLDSLGDVSATSVTAHATITPNGPPALNYHLEYSTDGVKWESGPNLVLGSQKSPQTVSQVLDLGGAGLEPSTFYHLRLVAKRPFFPAIVTPEKTFTTLPAPPLAETMGSPVRTSTTARLDGRIAPRNAAATYHFEYGDQGPCDSNPCTSTESHPAGSGGSFELVSQRLEGLQPGATYHYRVIADNGNPGSPVAGEDMTLTTLASEAPPLSHGHLPGPPDSDRAWELVSSPDTGGNPVGAGLASGAVALSDAGDRAVFGVSGGTPLSETGTVATKLFAERTPSGWQTKKILPSREEATGGLWGYPGGPGDLSSMVVENFSGGGNAGGFSYWRLRPDAPATQLYSNPDLHNLGARGTGNLLVSGDGSRVLAALVGSYDPSHSAPPGTDNFYDISSGGPPQLIDLLPDGTVAPCGISQASNGGAGLPPGGRRSSHTISADGSLAFFPAKSCGHTPERLYVRNFAAETTTLISPPPVTGRECNAQFIKSIPGAVFFYTQSRLVAEDVEPGSCSAPAAEGTGANGDVYRYDLGDGALHCLTCLAPGFDGNVLFTGGQAMDITLAVGVSDDGSRIYFTSGRRLAPGGPPKGGIYRLDVASGGIAYVGDFGFVGEIGHSFMNPDGSVVVFQSKVASVNALGGQQNGGTSQYYRYDDRERSLICVSCPADGSAPRGAVGGDAEILADAVPGPNLVPLSRDGEDFAFATPTPLVAADQNTAGAGQSPTVGADVYEWRSGRLLLVSDGLTSWPDSGPVVQGITPSGRDIFFLAATQYTQDALDGYKRLYDARIGGGFEFPAPPKPCPLEVCQGTPKGAPEEQAPGTASIAGAGNTASSGRVSCAKPKRKVRKAGKTRCVKPARKKHRSHKRANHNRRTAR